MMRICPRTHGPVGALVLGLALIVTPGCATPQPSPPAGTPAGPPASPAISPLSANDVSWLFPPPKTAADLAGLIAIKDLTMDPANPANRLSIWSDADFNNFLALADSPAAQVQGGAKIGLPAGVRTKDVWFVAGVRIDAGAPALTQRLWRRSVSARRSG